jgi:S-adenosyl-L-methionine hydrolase (adenosine-forming)
MARRQSRPIVTLTTDFGLCDHYAAAIKAAVLRQCPPANLIDITHLTPPQDILSASILLERAVAAFDAGAIHLAVVDPGVGTRRRLLITKIREQFIVCPDNGLVTWAWRRMGPGIAAELLWRPAKHSATFQGRDIMAPAAGLLAAGKKWTQLTKTISDPVLLPVELAERLEQARIIHIDHFGNATTNIEGERLAGRPAWVVRVRGRRIGPVRRVYADVADGRPIALIGSSGLLEIAVRNGSAAAELNLKPGDRVLLS